MKPDDKTLQEFARLYEEEFKEKISLLEADERFSRLVNVLRILTEREEFNDRILPK
jgi:DNA-binding SARP family transcriptional activator